MKKLFLILSIATCLTGCVRDQVSRSEIEKLISATQKSNDKILAKMQDTAAKYGKAGDEWSNEIIVTFSKNHRRIQSFLDSLNSIDKASRAPAAHQLIHSTLEKFSVDYPYEATIAEETPLDLIILQIVEQENVYLRQWQTVSAYKFNAFETTIMLDKVKFKPDENITGTMSLMGYSEERLPTMRLNGKILDVKAGKAHFSLTPSELAGRDSLKAEVVFPGTVFTKSIPVK
jgi:hypothetical protein